MCDVFVRYRDAIREGRRSFKRVGGVLLLLLFSAVVKSFQPPICEFIQRTDEAGFRDIVTPNEWQKRQWAVVSGVKGKRAAADQKRPGPMLWGIKGREREI